LNGEKFVQFVSKAVGADNIDLKSLDLLINSDKNASVIFTDNNKFLGLYCILESLFSENNRIVIISSSFRESKNLFSTMEEFTYKSDFLKNLTRVSREPDKFFAKIGSSSITAFPIGNGNRIRGQRPHILIILDAPSIEREFLDIVVSSRNFDTGKGNKTIFIQNVEEADKLWNLWKGSEQISSFLCSTNFLKIQ
jgi:hypothetical protein